MKFFKLLFSRTALVFLAIIIEFAFIVLSLNYWQGAYSWLKTITTCLGVIAFLSLINKQQLPEMKIVWLVCFMTFPLFGVTLYVFISNNKPSKKQLKIIKKSLEKLPVNNQKDEVLERTEKNIFGIEEYLHSTTSSYGYTNSKIHFLSSGEMFFDDLLEN